MNAKNPNGPIGYKSPGRRPVADEMFRAAPDKNPDAHDDPTWRRLAGVASRASAKAERAAHPRSGVSTKRANALLQQATTAAQIRNVRADEIVKARKVASEAA